MSRSGEKLIPKATLLRALHEIMDAAFAPEKLVAGKVPTTATVDEARAFALGYIAGIARDALGAEAPTTGWLVAAKL